MAKLASTLLKK